MTITTQATQMTMKAQAMQAQTTNLKATVCETRRRGVLWGLGVMGVLFAGQAWAACAPYPVDRPMNFNFGTVTVPASLAVGSDIVRVYLPGNWTETMRCTPAATLTGALGQFTQISALGNKIYDTNIPGVGVRVFWSSDSLNNRFPLSLSGFTNVGGGVSMVAFLVKTAPVTGAGTLTPGVLGRLSMNGQPVFQTLNITGGSVISPPSCTVTTAAINVPLGDVKKTDFTPAGVGATTAELPFDIGLNCDANVSVSLTLDGPGDASGATGVLALNTTTNMARGLGAQLLYNGSPVSLGTQLSVGTAASSGPFLIPLSARYYQTAAAMTPGIANASGTFTVTYQ